MSRLQPPRAVGAEEVSLAHQGLPEGLDASKCLILQLGLACPTNFCQEQGRNIASCSSYEGGHRCSEALGVEAVLHRPRHPGAPTASVPQCLVPYLRAAQCSVVLPSGLRARISTRCGTPAGVGA